MADRLYHFYFLDIKKPITVRAVDSEAAREILKQKPLPEPYSGSRIIGQSTSSLVTGVSHMFINGKKVYWDGKDFTIAK